MIVSLLKNDERIKTSFYFSLFYLIISALFRVFLLIYSKKLGADSFFIILAGIVSDIPLFFFLFSISAFIYKIIFKIKIRYFHLVLYSIFVFFLIFLFFTEYFFFEEFNSRFNSVAVDYLIYPTEVFVNIWQSYNVVLIVTLSMLASVILVYFLNKSITLKEYKIKSSGLVSFLFAVLFSLIIPFNGFNIISDRIKREISKNGVLSFFYAAYYHNLDYDAYYPTLKHGEMVKLARELVRSKNDEFCDKPLNPIERKVRFKTKPNKKNVIIFLTESFGSNFIGALGSNKNITPEFDSLSKEGVLFTNIYSIGNRTVRGLEGVLAGFAPLPGESIVKMKFSKNILTLPQILKSNGYKNYFIYGGRGIFDNMKPFAMRYGFDYFIEQKDYKNPTFKTIWGVCDEDIFSMTLNKAKESYEKRENFFFLTLSVSNHKPYTYPKGRIPEDPDKKKRNYAVKYTDWAFGDFFRKAKKEKFYKDTIFIIIADHGARVYGSQEIPIKSYEIPLLIISSDLKPGRSNVLGSSLDIPSTVMDLLKIDYVSPFFGKSLLNNEKNRWIALNHNRDIGYYDGKNLIVLGLNNNNYYYIEKGKSQLEKTQKDNLISLKEKYAISIFQTAWEIYKNGLN